MASQQGLAVANAEGVSSANGPETLSVQDVISMGSVGSDEAGGKAGIPVMLEVTVNQETRPGLFAFIQRGNLLWVSKETLDRLELHFDTTTEPLVSLNDLVGVQVNYQPTQQRLDLTVDLSTMHSNVTQLDPGFRPDGAHRLLSAPSPLGLLLNYDLYGSHSSFNGSSKNVLNGSGELRIFKNQWVFSNTEVFTFPMEGPRNHGRNQGEQQVSVQRLDTFFRQSFLDSETTLTLGDTLSSSVYATRPTRMGGIQFGRDFSLDPYAIRQPLSLFQGSATLPSDVELYVDGLKQYESKVPVGPFALNTLPSVSGSGQANLVVTDILGRRQELSIPFYNTPSLLAEGLSEWSAEVGKPRQNYGLTSFDYAGPWFASGTWRHGWNPHVTSEAHALVSHAIQVAYAGGQVLLGRNGGVLSVGVGGSQTSLRHGNQWQLGYQWQSNRWVFSADTIRASDGYRDLPSLLGSNVARRTDRVNASVVLNTWGNVGVSYFALKYSHSPASRYTGLNWSTNFGSSVYFSASVNQNMIQPRDRSVFLSVSINLSNRMSLNSSIQKQSDQSLSSSVSLEHPLSAQEGWGWRGEVDHLDRQTFGEVDVTHRNAWNETTGGVQKTPDGVNAYASTRGAFVWMAGQTFLSRQTSQSFSVVSTDGRPDVPVFLENRPYGKTNAAGYLLVSDLQPWQNNKIRIDALGLPADVQVDTIEKQAIPPRFAGTITQFKLEKVVSKVFHLVDEKGQDLPVGTAISINGKNNASVVGYDGQVYVNNIQGAVVHLSATMEGDTTCHVTADPDQTANPLPCVFADKVRMTPP